MTHLSRRSSCPLLVLLALAAPPKSAAQRVPDSGTATRSVYLDRAGVIRWQDSRQEVALFGANYTLPSASDYRAAGYLERNRKQLIEEDMAHFARMGWDALRLSFWGDWENSDRNGNLVANEHLDLQDYLIAQARARGIYILLSPIVTYNANWPDALEDSTNHGFSRYYDRGSLGTDRAAITAQANYLRQLLEHVNPYTGSALKDEPAILFVEPVNEPSHHPEDLSGSINYINALIHAIRSTGCNKLVFYNVSQDFRIVEAIRKSGVQGVSFGWYPSGLNSGHELQGNYLRTVDAYEPMRSPQLAGMPRIVYEFDTPDLRTGYMYPAMVRAFRSVGTQYAAMFAYDMLATSSRNLGWQTHYLNLVYTPRKALSAVIAAEAMRRLPRLQDYGTYPGNTRFGDFRVSYEENSSLLLADDAFMHAGSTRNAPPRPAHLRRIAAYGSSPVVAYEGEGVYFLDKVRDGVWRLEVYPDAVPVRDPFEMPSLDKIVTGAIYRTWPMRIELPDLGPSFNVHVLTTGSVLADVRAQAGAFPVTPGLYVLSAQGPVLPQSLPAFIGRVGMAEFHAPAPDSIALRVVADAAPEYLTGRPVSIGARIVAATPPDAVTLFVRPLGRSWFTRYTMQHVSGYDYRARIPPDSLRNGSHEYVISVSQGGTVTTFPDGTHRRPGDWDFSAQTLWRTTLVHANAPLRLFRPAEDAAQLSFTRIGDAGRHGIFAVVPSEVTGEPVLHFELPLMGDWVPDDYTASLVIKDRISARADAMNSAKAVKLRLRGTGPSQVLHITLVERDGTSWSTSVAVDPAWSEHSIPLADFKPARSVMLPQGFPGQWSYGLPAAQGRGGAGDGVRMTDVERLQLSMRKEAGMRIRAPYGVEIESVTVMF